MNTALEQEQFELSIKNSVASIDYDVWMKKRLVFLSYSMKLKQVIDTFTYFKHLVELTYL